MHKRLRSVRFVTNNTWSFDAKCLDITRQEHW